MSSQNSSHTKSLAALRAIWKIVFGDSEEFIDLYFSRHYTNAKTFISLQDGQIAAQAQCFLYQMTTAATDFCSIPRPQPQTHKAVVTTVGYVSGLATLPQYRRQGHAANIMRQLHSWLQTQGADYSMLIPADETAAQWYQSHFGYLRAARTPQYMISEQQLSRCTEHRELTPELINLIQQHLASTPYTIQHIAQDLRDQLAVCQMSGGGLYSLPPAGKHDTTIHFMAEKIMMPDGTASFRVLDYFYALPAPTSYTPFMLHSATSHNFSHQTCMYLPISNNKPLSDEIRITLMLD